MSLFKKPKRNVRQRQNYSDEDEDIKDERNSLDDEDNLNELHSSIERFKQGKKKSQKKKDNNTASSKEDGDKKSSKLSFDDFEADADDGMEIFKVKKSSQSRRLMKQKKAEMKRQKEENFPPVPPLPPQAPAPPPPRISSDDPTTTTIIDDDDIGLRVKNNLVINKQPQDESRTLAGYEAEALHLEEEDLENSDNSDDNEDEKKNADPLQEMLQRGAIPDANAIYEARKRRQALREQGETKNGGAAKNQRFISLSSTKTDELPNHQDGQQQEDDSDDGEDKRTVMYGVRTNDEVRKESFERLHGHHQVDEKDQDQYRWEEQQIRKAMRSAGNLKSESVSPSAPIINNDSNHSNSNLGYYDSGASRIVVNREAPIAYNLEGIKDRLKKRITSLEEVHRRHKSDADKIVDDLVDSQSIIEEKQSKLPQFREKNYFYQDLRGYVADLVECFNEKLTNIKYVETKYHKIKADTRLKLIERRREDVRDQMRELSTTNSNKPLQYTAEENNEEWLRQRRAAEREGRRRRRAQLRSAKAPGTCPPHNDGCSSDDELSSHDQATISKSRQDVENQARTIMSDVVEEFSTVDGILQRIEEWRRTDIVAYNEAFVSSCLPKMIAPLVTLQLLFWNPLEEHVNVENMEWHNRVALFSQQIIDSSSTNDQDSSKYQASDQQLLSLVLEKVLLVKINHIVKAAYDPMSASQTQRLTQLLFKLRNIYPTLTGTSKQVRDLLNSVVDKMKSCVDNDVYIPLGYSKQYLENPSNNHAVFFNRQVWGCYKLFKNILTWHGLLADKIIADMALNSLLYRYLIIGLGVSPNQTESVSRCRHIVNAIPSDWKGPKGRMKAEIQRFAGYLANLGSTPGLSREAVKEVVSLLRTLGFNDEADSLERKILRAT